MDILDAFGCGRIEGTNLLAERRRNSLGIILVMVEVNKEMLIVIESQLTSYAVFE